jgi:cytoskeleton protein RodZ
MSQINPNREARQEELPAAAAPVTVAAGPSPGTRLREAREALGMSIADAAQAIRLSARQIGQLEADAWDQLPGETFVRGFLRNYARLLKLDPEPLLATVHNQLPQAIELPESTDEEIPVEGSSAGQMVSILAGAGLLLLAAVLVYLFWPPAAPQRATPPRAPALAAPTAPDAAPPPAAIPAEASAPPAAASQVAGSAGADAPGVPAPAGAPAAPSAVVAAPVATPPAVDPPRATTPVAAASAVEPAEGANSDPARPFVVVDGPQRAVRIAVRELSWVEVRDAGGNTLLAYNFAPGTVRNVRGVAPLEIIVGNAAGVDVSVDGKPVDVAARARANVAKLAVE